MRNLREKWLVALIVVALVNIGLFPCGMVMLAASERPLARGWSHKNASTHAVITVDITNQAVHMRVCPGRVSYQCSCCFDCPDATAPRSGSLVFDHGNAHRREQQRLQLLNTSALRLAGALDFTTTTTTNSSAASNRTSPECGCGVSSYDWGSCPLDDALLFDGCPQLVQRLQIIARSVYAAGIIGITMFVSIFVCGFPVVYVMERQRRYRSASYLIHLVAYGLEIAFTLPAVALVDELVSTTTCIPGSKFGSLAAQGFDSVDAPRAALIVGGVFSCIGAATALGFLLLELEECREGGIKRESQDTQPSDDSKQQQQQQLSQGLVPSSEQQQQQQHQPQQPQSEAAEDDAQHVRPWRREATFDL